MSQSVGPQGGTVTDSELGVSVQVPAGALDSDTAITIVSTSNLPPGSLATPVSGAVQLGPEGLQFKQPVTVTLPIDLSKLPAGASTAQVTVFTAAHGSSSWAALTRAGGDDTHVSAQTSHFSDFVAAVPVSGGSSSSSGSTGSSSSSGSSGSGSGSGSTTASLTTSSGSSSSSGSGSSGSSSSSTSSSTGSSGTSTSGSSGSTGAAPVPLHVLSTPSKDAVEGQVWTYQLVLSKPGTATFQLTSGPLSGATLDPAGGLLKWTPDATDLAPQAFTVEATVGSETATQTFSVNVAHPVVQAQSAVDPADPNGGTVTVDAPLSPIKGSGVSLPPGSLTGTGPVNVSISAVTDAPVPPSAALSGVAATDLAPVEFGPTGTTFAQPVKIYLPISQALLASSSNMQVQTYDYATGRWTTVPLVSVDRTSGVAVASVNHFSTYVVAPQTDVVNLQLGTVGASACSNVVAVQSPLQIPLAQIPAGQVNQYAGDGGATAADVLAGLAVGQALQVYTHVSATTTDGIGAQSVWTLTAATRTASGYALSVVTDTHPAQFLEIPSTLQASDPTLESWLDAQNVVLYLNQLGTAMNPGVHVDATAEVSLYLVDGSDATTPPAAVSNPLGGAHAETDVITALGVSDSDCDEAPDAYDSSPNGDVPPVLATLPQSPVHTQVGNTVSFAVGSDSPTPVFTWSESDPGLGLGSTGGNATSVTATPSAPGTYRLTVTATRNTASTSASWDITVDPAQVANTPPSVKVSASTTTLRVGEYAQLSAYGTDAEQPASSLTYSWSSSPAAQLSSASGASIVFSASQAGTYTISCVANDGLADSQPATATVTVLDAATNRPPAQPTVTPVSADVTLPDAGPASVTLTASAADPDPGDTVSYAFTADANNNAGATLTAQGSSAQVSSATSGTYVFYVVAIDNHGAASPATAVKVVVHAPIAANDVDQDGDGYPASIDCDDNDPATHPGAYEACPSTKDLNCDGKVLSSASQCDNDHDGFTPAQGDCDDADKNTYPGAPELCDGKKNDCSADGGADFGYNLGASCTAGTGACANTGVLVCNAVHTGTACSANPLSPSCAGKLCGSSDGCGGICGVGSGCVQPDGGADGGASDGGATDGGATDGGARDGGADGGASDGGSHSDGGSGSFDAGSSCSLCANGFCVTSCPSGETNCNGQCRDLETDPGNCGSCGKVCPTGQTCSQGACVSSCYATANGGACGPQPLPDGGISCGFCPPNMQTFCSGGQFGSACVDITSDSTNCGACGNVCGQGETCQNGSCAPLCAAGEVCANGACAVSCPSGTLDCSDGGVGTHFCTDTQKDVLNCGACGNACASGQQCQQGICVQSCNLGQGGGGCGVAPYPDGGVDCGQCPQPYRTACQLTDPNGQQTGQLICVDTQTDGLDCGGCGNVCPQGFTCQGGSCVSQCPNGSFCASGVCATSCPSGTTPCGTTDAGFPNCVTTQTDPGNCGGCGVVCPNGEACFSGACAAMCQPSGCNCPPGYACGPNGSCTTEADAGVGGTAGSTTTSGSTGGSCAPSCVDQQCGGPNTCGTGTCLAGSGCVEPSSDGGICQPRCQTIACGNPDSCGVGGCMVGSGCTEFYSDGGMCAPKCLGLTCGAPDGCGGICDTSEGCVSSSGGTTTGTTGGGGGPGAPCQLDSDCASGVCDPAVKYCSAHCTSDAQCPQPSTCNFGDGFCEISGGTTTGGTTGSSCTPSCQNQTCGAPDSCGTAPCEPGSGCVDIGPDGGTCMPSCTGLPCNAPDSCGGSPCRAGSGCYETEADGGSCVPKCQGVLCGSPDPVCGVPCDPGSGCTQSTTTGGTTGGGGGGPGAPCALDGDCSSGLVCDQNTHQCSAHCASDAQCPQPSTCNMGDGFCEIQSTDAGSCTPSCQSVTCGTPDPVCGQICNPGSGCTQTYPDGGICQPSCQGTFCGGQDGCGGTCSVGSGCTFPEPDGGSCVSLCTGQVCGGSDGCGQICSPGSGCTSGGSDGGADGGSASLQVTSMHGAVGLQQSVRYGDTLVLQLALVVADGGPSGDVSVADPSVFYDQRIHQLLYTPSAFEVGTTHIIHTTMQLTDGENIPADIQVQVGTGLVSQPITGRSRRLAGAPINFTSGTNKYVLVPDLATLDIYDVTSGGAPVALAQLAVPGDAVAVAALYNYALVADSHYGIDVVDLSTPSAPHLAGVIPLSNHGDALTAIDADPMSGMVVVGTAIGGVAHLDLSGLAQGFNPNQEVDLIPLPDDAQQPKGTWVQAISQHNGIIYASNEDQSSIVLVDAASNQVVSTLPLHGGDYWQTPASATAVLPFSENGHDYIVAVDGWAEMIEVFDVTTPAAPFAVTGSPCHVVWNTDFKSAAIQGSRLLIADAYNGNVISVDLTDLTQLSIATDASTPSPMVDQAAQIAVTPLTESGAIGALFGVTISSDGTRVYAATFSDGLSAWAYAPATAPTALGAAGGGPVFFKESSNGNFTGLIASSGTTFYAPDGGQVGGSFAATGEAIAVGTNAALAGRLVGSADLVAFDLSSGTPVQGATFSTSATTAYYRQLSAVPNSALFLAAGGGNAASVAIVDATNPASPTVVGNFGAMVAAGDGGFRAPDNFGRPTSVTSDGRYAYAVMQFADNATGISFDSQLEIFDISNPASPSLVEIGPEIFGQSGAIACDPTRKRVYVGVGPGNVAVAVDVTDPANPSITGALGDLLGDGSSAISLAPNHLLVATSRATYSAELNAVGDFTGNVEPLEHHQLQDFDDFQHGPIAGSLQVHGSVVDVVRTGGIDRIAICGFSGCTP